MGTKGGIAKFIEEAKNSQNNPNVLNKIIEAMSEKIDELQAKAEAYDRVMSGGRKTLKEWSNLLGMIFVVDQEGYGFAYKDTPVCYDEDGGWDSTTGVYFALIPPDLIDFNGDWTTSLTLPDGWEDAK
jgi:hypothetical protein